MIGYGFVFDRDILFQVGGFKYLGFSPIPGDSGSNLTSHIFQMGWFNHQLAICVCVCVAFIISFGHPEGWEKT